MEHKKTAGAKGGSVEGATTAEAEPEKSLAQSASSDNTDHHSKTSKDELLNDGYTPEESSY